MHTMQQPVAPSLQARWGIVSSAVIAITARRKGSLGRASPARKACFKTAPKIIADDSLAASLSNGLTVLLLPRTPSADLMRRRASRCLRLSPGTRVARGLLAIAAVVAVGFGQLSTSWHEATVQHVRCAEHGELTHVRSAPDHDVAAQMVETLHRDAVRSAALETVDAHDHCGFLFAIKGGAPAPLVRVAVGFQPPPEVARHVAPPVESRGRAGVLASAPKTSPPSA